MAADSSAAARWAVASLDAASEAPRVRDARAQQRVVYEAFARALSYSLAVPGVHPSGLRYDDLLRILAEQGRDFTADSTRLRDYVAAGLASEFKDARRPPGVTVLRQFAGALILEWVLNRLEGQLRDVPIKPNAPAYRAWKRRHANYSATGMRTGALRNVLRDKARVIVR